MNLQTCLRFQRALCASVAFLLSALLIQGAEIAGKVVGVSDGDTITLLSADKEQFKIRLFGIDAPESNQAFGSKAKQFTSEQCFGKSVTVQEEGKDRYGRTIGVVLLPGGTNLNLSILRNGYAWWYRDYAKNEKEYQAAETEAREAKRGLWAEKNPVPPWDFRKNKGSESEKPKATEEKSLSHWLTTSSGKRHNSSCRYFKNSKGRASGPNEGVACKICGG